MNRFFLFLFSFFSFLLLTELSADTSSQVKKKAETPDSFESFTGKVTKNKVRVRFKPIYDDQVLKEAHAGDLFVIVGEDHDFYAVQPPLGLKGYVYRTYILDNIVEANRVNVRVNPDLESFVITQLYSGDKVEGTIASANNKWLEIPAPSSARFYIAKEFIEKIGDSSVLAKLEQKREEGEHLLQTVSAFAKIEMTKPYQDIPFHSLQESYQKLINNYPEFPKIGTTAQNELAALGQLYLSKKLTFLEEQSANAIKTKEMNQKLAQELDQHKLKLALLQQETGVYRAGSSTLSEAPQELSISMKSWMPVEEGFFQSWVHETGNSSFKDYQNLLEKQAFILEGAVEPYDKKFNNRPGDYLLTNLDTLLPFAFLYSTSVNLQEYVGKSARFKVISRPNNHFAFPAYLVIGVE